MVQSNPPVTHASSVLEAPVVVISQFPLGGPTISKDPTINEARKGFLINGGFMPYQQAWDFQRQIWARRVEGSTLDTFLLVQHPHTYTLGVRGKPGNVLWQEAEQRERGVEVVQIDRGGDVTYHGPNQLVLYPIIHLQERKMDLHRYLRALEEVVIRTLAEYGVTGGRIKEYTGVWVGGAKIAAIGIKVSKWVTMHGIAFNVSPDLNYFGGIIPCGLCGREVTSLEKLTGRRVPVSEVVPKISRHTADVFEVEMEELSCDELVKRIS